MHRHFTTIVSRSFGTFEFNSTFANPTQANFGQPRDLNLKFDRTTMTNVLELDDLPGCAFVELELSGTLLDGTEFAATDCIRLVPPGDIGGDCAVGVADFLFLLGTWGSCPAGPADCAADFDGSGDVGVTDLLILLANWG